MGLQGCLDSELSGPFARFKSEDKCRVLFGAEHGVCVCLFFVVFWQRSGGGTESVNGIACLHCLRLDRILL